MLSPPDMQILQGIAHRWSDNLKCFEKWQKPNVFFRQWQFQPHTFTTFKRHFEGGENRNKMQAWWFSNHKNLETGTVGGKQPGLVEAQMTLPTSLGTLQNWMTQLSWIKSLILIRELKLRTEKWKVKELPETGRRKRRAAQGNVKKLPSGTKMGFECFQIKKRERKITKSIHLFQTD